MAEQPVYVIGVDAGGTKTQAVVVDGNGRILSWGKGGPANPNRVSSERLRASLQQAINSALSGDDSPSPQAVAAVCLGVAGGRGSQGLISETVVKLGIRGTITVVGDTTIAFWGAIRRAYGVIVIAGTGSIAYGVSPRGDTATAGGRGYLIGDEGSAYDIGRAGIMAAVRAYDGRGPATALLERVLQFFHLEAADQVIPVIYDPSNDDGRTRISDFAPLVTQAAREGDTVSRDILNSAGHELGWTAVAVARKLALCEREFELALIGGVFQAEDLIIPSLRDVVLRAAPKARIFVSHRPPALGAARLALREIGRDIRVEACTR